MGLNYPAQLRFKEEKVRRALERYPSLKAVAVSPTREALQPLGYRTNVKLVMGRSAGGQKTVSTGGEPTKWSTSATARSITL